MLENRWQCLLMLCAVLLIAGAFRSAPAQDREAPHVQVHEWGVLTYGTDCTPDLLSAPSSPYATVSPFDDGEIVVRAPVVYFHGPEFTGALTVESGLGRIIDSRPRPDYLSSDRRKAEWRDLACDFSVSRWALERDAREIPLTELDDLTLYMGFWRQVESAVIRRGEDFEDRFVYYEIGLDQLPLTTPLIHSRGGSVLIPDDFDGEMLVFRLTDQGTDICLIEDAADATASPEDWGFHYPGDDEVIDVLQRWAVDGLLPEEVLALWATWRGYLLGGENFGRAAGSAVVLYRLPEETVEETCSLVLETDEGYPVDYCRFILGAMEVPLVGPMFLYEGEGSR
ncbi:hypothetical protein JW921_03240 [Candidatus Fermentibacterales bacterium]|nr:hypothetical protein [Candidatus Fermentibacterales bacterium]